MSIQPIRTQEEELEFQNLRYMTALVEWMRVGALRQRACCGTEASNSMR